MTKEYTCELCKKTFNQKIDYTRHKEKKAPCVSLEELKKITQNQEIKQDYKTNLITLFKNLLNILRDSEVLTGEKALRNMSFLFILKLIEPMLGNEIDIDNYNYDFSNIEDEFVDIHKTKLLKIVRFSNLADENEDNLPHNLSCLWDDILSKHPSTRNIFLKGKGFDIQRKKTFKVLIDKLYALDLTNCDYDVLGNSYEEVIKDIMTGKVFGQFFTQPLVKKMMVQLIDPQIHPDGTIDTCGDPTMGTGGFLITYLQYILKQAKTKNINPDWNFIKKEGLYGKEIVPETYQLAVSNMLISSGHMFENIERGDSIRDPITRKFDNVLANPPYGINGLTYDDFQYSLKEEYIPIKTNNAVTLFIQAIIYMLKINGKCAVVLPDGQDLFSKTIKALINVREYLMKTCDLKEIIYLPAGMFNYADIKTCVFYFIKKKEGTDVLDVNIKYSNTTQKEIRRDYKFTKTHNTTKVKFYDYNPYEDIKTLLVEVPIDKIVCNSYSLNYAEYMRDETDEQQYDEGVVVKTLGEICEVKQGNPLTKTNIIDGIYDVIGGGKIIGKHNQKNRDGNDFTLTRVGDININYIDKPYYLTDNGFSLKSTQENIMTKYIYYLLSHNKDYLINLYQGTAQKVISKTNLKLIKIPIPPLERQQEVVEYLDFIYEKANKTSLEKIAELKQLNLFCLQNQKIFGKNDVKTLGEVCCFKNGKGIKKDTLIEGDYPVIGGGQKPMGFHNEYNTYENTILCSSSGAYAGFISKYDKKVWASDCFSVIPKVKFVETNYLYYLLKITQDKIYKLQTGTAQPHVYSKDLQNLKIPIPSLERQQEIVKYCEYNDTLIKQLEKEIENNKALARQFITNIVNVNLPTERLAQANITQTKPDPKGMTIKKKIINKDQNKKALHS